jgi:hypothetical protein
VLRDRIRTLLNIRVKRRNAVMGTKPRLNSKITVGGMRMLVTSTPVDDLWHFFSLQGWREITNRRDRRRYVNLPRVSFGMLAHCSGSEREIRYRQILDAASHDPTRAGSQVPKASGASTATWIRTP